MDTARAKVNVIEHELEEMGNLSKIFDRQLTETADQYNVYSVLNRVDENLNKPTIHDEDPFHFDNKNHHTPQRSPRQIVGGVRCV